jgi:hypothetical protein
MHFNPVAIPSHCGRSQIGTASLKFLSVKVRAERVNCQSPVVIIEVIAVAIRASIIVYPC